MEFTTSRLFTAMAVGHIVYRTRHIQLEQDVKIRKWAVRASVKLNAQNGINDEHPRQQSKAGSNIPPVPPQEIRNPHRRRFHRRTIKKNGR